MTSNSVKSTRNDEWTGIIGAGRMGVAIGEKLISKGYKLKVYNRTSDKVKGLVELGAQSVRSIEELADVRTIITMVSDDKALLDIALASGGLVEAMRVGSVHVAMSTVDPATVLRLAGAHSEAGQFLVSAPVFGTPDDVRRDQVVTCVSGNVQAKDAATTLLGSIAKSVFDVGTEPHLANIVKLTGNFIMASAIEALAEGFALAEKNGLERETVAEVLCNTIFGCPVYKGYGFSMARNEYSPVGFTLKLALKDLLLIEGISTRSYVPVPMANVVKEKLLARLAKSGDADDWATLGVEARENAGLVG